MSQVLEKKTFHNTRYGVAYPKRKLHLRTINEREEEENSPKPSVVNLEDSEGEDECGTQPMARSTPKRIKRETVLKGIEKIPIKGRRLDYGLLTDKKDDDKMVEEPNSSSKDQESDGNQESASATSTDKKRGYQQTKVQWKVTHQKDYSHGYNKYHFRVVESPYDNKFSKDKLFVSFGKTTKDEPTRYANLCVPASVFKLMLEDLDNHVALD